MAEILGISKATFGTMAAEKYAAHLFQAMFDVADDPYRRGSKPFGENVGTVRLYHLVHSNERVPNPPGAVKKPRHVLVYEPASMDTVDVIGIVYDTIPPEEVVPQMLGSR
jgi:toxin ParE1/3/4